MHCKSFFFILFVIYLLNESLCQSYGCCDNGVLVNQIEKRFPFYNRLFLKTNSFIPGTILQPNYGFNPNLPTSYSDPFAPSGSSNNMPKNPFDENETTSSPSNL
uniref:Secreted protein n=1 Tax=Acrobeloides nanus TaxID=290746 RepID=A0A914BVC6_9BILA